MSVSTVYATCPHCDLEYWLVIDLTVVAQLKKSVTCGHCKTPFDLRERVSAPPDDPSEPPPFDVEDEPDSFTGRAKFSRVDRRMRHSWFAAAVPGLEPEPQPEPPQKPVLKSEPAVSIRPYFSQPPLEIDVADLEEFEPVLVLEPPRLPREASGTFDLDLDPPPGPELPAKAPASLELDLASMMPQAKPAREMLVLDSLSSSPPASAEPPSEKPRRKLVVPKPRSRKKR